LIEVNRVLKMNGMAIFSTPNAQCADAVAKIFEGQHPHESQFYHYDFDVGRMHPLEYAWGQLFDLFEMNGFKIRNFISINFAPLTPNEIECIEIMCSYRTRHSLSLGKHFGRTWVIVAEKTSNISDFTCPSSLFA
jgi:hypothetical protein